MTTKLRPYQKSISQRIQQGSCAIWAEMGLGKTLATLHAVDKLIKENRVRRILILAPLRVANHVWGQEIEKWGFNLSYAIATGTPSARMRAVHSSVRVIIINYENLQWLIGVKGRYWNYDMIICDEFSKLKSPSTKRFKALRKVAKDTKFFIGLTGTPACNSMLDLWSQTCLLDQGERLEKSFGKYRVRYFESDFLGYTWTLKPRAERTIRTLLSDVSISLKTCDYLELPAYVPQVHEVEFKNTDRDKYDELKKEMILSFEDSEASAPNSAVLTGKLLQFCNGALYIDECDSSAYEHMHDLKLDMLEEIIEESAGENILIAYNFKSDIGRLKASFKGLRDIKEPGAIDQWNNGELNLMAAHPQSAGHGLNLQTGGHIIVWFGLTWSLENYLQFNARLRRSGQKKPVFVHHITVKDSIEQKVMSVLEEREKSQAALIDYMKIK
jgi:SNF2 family DNA or RNA helicase